MPRPANQKQSITHTTAPPALDTSHETFCECLAAGMQQSEAFKRAFPKRAQGMTRSSLHSTASRLAASDNIRQRVTEIARKAQAATQLHLNQVLHALSQLAFGDPRQVMQWGPNGVEVIDSKTLTPQAAALIDEVQCIPSENGPAVRVKLTSRLQALRTLGDLMLRSQALALQTQTAQNQDGTAQPAKAVMIVPQVLDETQWATMMQAAQPAPPPQDNR